MITRQTIIHEVSRIHLVRGGKPNPSSNPIATVKSALSKLRRKGLVESLSHGYWRVVSSSDALRIEELIEVEETDDSYESESIEELDTQTEILSDADVIIGVGDSAVYLYRKNGYKAPSFWDGFGLRLACLQAQNTLK